MNDQITFDAIDRLREMFGIESTDPETVFAGLEAYDAHNLRTIDRLQAQLADAEKRCDGWRTLFQLEKSERGETA